MNAFKFILALTLSILAMFVTASEAKYKPCPCTRNVSLEQPRHQTGNNGMRRASRHACKAINKELLVSLSKAIRNAKKIKKDTENIMIPYTVRQCRTAEPLGDMLRITDEHAVTNCSDSFSRLSQLYILHSNVSSPRRTNLLSNLKMCMCHLEVVSYAVRDVQCDADAVARDVEQVTSGLHSMFDDTSKCQVRDCLMARDTVKVLQAVKETCGAVC